jgi:hypothetical protein
VSLTLTASTSLSNLFAHWVVRTYNSFVVTAAPSVYASTVQFGSCSDIFVNGAGDLNRTVHNSRVSFWSPSHKSRREQGVITMTVSEEDVPGPEIIDA